MTSTFENVVHFNRIIINNNNKKENFISSLHELAHKIIVLPYIKKQFDMPYTSTETTHYINLGATSQCKRTLHRSGGNAFNITGLATATPSLLELHAFNPI